MNVCLVAVLGTCILSACQTSQVKTSAAALIGRLDGNIALEAMAASPGGLGPRRLEADTLGLDNTEFSGMARIDVREQRFNFGVSGLIHDTEDSGLINQAFGQMAPGLNVRSDLRFINGKAIASWDVLQTGPLRLAPALMFDYVRLDLEVRETQNVGSIRSEEVTNDLFAPMPAAVAELDFGAVGGTVEFGGMNADFGDARGTILDLETKVRLTPIERLDVFAGFRWIALDVLGRADDNPYDADLDYFGYFLGGAFIF